MVLTIQIVITKACPVCKVVLNKVLLPLANAAPDLLVLDVKEGIFDRNVVGMDFRMPGGDYHTFFQRTPEIYFKDKLILLHSPHPKVLIKLLNMILEELYKEMERKGVSPIRRAYIEKVARDIYDSLVEDYKKLKKMEKLGLLQS